MVVPYQRHQKRKQLLATSSFDISQLLGKPFWLWDKREHLTIARDTNEHCCFNPIVGLPQKDKREYPLFDYEEILYESLMSVDKNFKDKHLWVKKATGLGITEFMLRMMAWLCTRDEAFDGSQMCIVTGPNIEMATKLIKRMKGIFEPKLGLTFSNKETVLELNGCTIEAYPSNHIDSYRALDNPKFILLDESDFFRKGEQEDVRHVSERYIGKSDPIIVMVSTPNNPGGLFYQIEQEPADTCLFKRLKMDYHYGLGKIYTQHEIDKAKQSPGFDREYGLQYLGKVGNVFNEIQILKAIELGEQYKHLPINPYSIHGIGVDIGFGSSNTAVVATELLTEEAKIRVAYAQEWEHGDPQAIVNSIFNLYLQYGSHNTFIWVDGSNRAFCNHLKVAFSESLNWEKSRITPDSIKVLPVSFAGEHKQMLSHLAMMLSKEYLCIPSEFDKLIMSLRTAYANEYSFDKEQTSYSDSLDALRLSCKMFRMINWIDMSNSNNNVKSLQRMNNHLSERHIWRSVTYFIRLETLMGRRYSTHQSGTLWQ